MATEAKFAFREWLDPESLKAVSDERFDAGEWLRSRAVPEKARIDVDRIIAVGCVLLSAFTSVYFLVQLARIFL